MSIEKLKRVMWRLKELIDGNACHYVNGYLREIHLRAAIMHEIGTDEETIRLNIDKLVELGWVKRVQKRRWTILKESSEL